MSIEKLTPFEVPAGRALHVGLTGGIGAGKSSVGKQLLSLGATVVDADALARQVVEPGSAGLRELVGVFGTQILTADGHLDRSALGTRVFANDYDMQLVESLLHPLIAEEKNRVFSLLGAGQVGVYEVPLLVEKDLAGDFDVVVVVETPLPLRLERLRDRGMSEQEALSRIGAQATDEQRRSFAHLVIVNDGHEDDLRVKVKQLAAQHLGL